MRQLSWALIGMAGLIVIGLQTAEAGVTCRIVPGWCPPERGFNATHGNNTNSNNSNSEHAEQRPTSVPEPATLMLLGAGVSALGAAALRRRKQK
jgi:hypothetical protein